ncbi:MAG: ATP-binding protein [Thermoplasmata archaeon]|nr:ATP-binding protein [Thermoplasmata archaeon]
MKRLIYDELLEWKSDPARKPLVLDGVRQCGKTYLLKELGSEEFDNCVYCNFEEAKGLKALFSGSMEPSKIVRDIELMNNVKITPGKTLLILDEIQECDSAITSLKYFCEHMPELHVACAGPLLGVLKSEASFPVGKVDTKHLYPMNFCEYLMAEGETSLAEFILSDPDPEDISEPIHEALQRLMRDYCIVGGMPEVVHSWVTQHDINKVDSLQRELLQNYEKDFAKHGGSMLEMLTSIWESLPSFLSRENHKFVFKELKKDGRSDDFRDPVQWLSNAHLIYKVNLMKGHAYPPSIGKDENQYKLYMCDIGLLRAMAGHPAGIMLTENDDAHLYKGGMYENLAVCEMMSAGAGNLYYWREGRYEVDLISAIDGRTVPIEVKSGTNFSTESLNLYQKKFNVSWGLIISNRMPRKGNGRDAIPFYLAGNMQRARNAHVDDCYVNASGLPYEFQFRKEDWIEVGKGFRLIIPVSRHHRGLIPKCNVQIRDGDAWKDTGASISTDNGDVIIESNSRFDGRAVIRI